MVMPPAGVPDRRSRAGVFGGGGGFVFSVHGNTIAEFCLFVYHQLKNNDFSFLDFMTPRAFEYFQTLRTYVLLAGGTLRTAYERGEVFWDIMAERIASSLRLLFEIPEKIASSIQTEAQARQDALELADRILAPESRELILFLPPEGKGQLLYALCKRHWPFPFRAERQEDAILVILGTIQTWREYKEILEHLSIDGSRQSWYQNFGQCIKVDSHALTKERFQ
ncbi:hypothetical protein L9S41_19155 [Geoalkalibacter halelectricus]|uniref:Uncharacterized protein n=1 Tax=Geoalkalibacter halelectricus TaxID=2847045 RepID=A0ABY5ZKR9_9BACT|nr:hypothetical protein [Geoalkalibacter halelectricus]UWZ79772.1 hypothetical protein L9S41_19155 [Geoalkalibacter halelectricus]